MLKDRLKNIGVKVDTDESKIEETKNEMKSENTKKAKDDAPKVL